MRNLPKPDQDGRFLARLRLRKLFNEIIHFYNSNRNNIMAVLRINTMTYANHPGYTRLMFKTNCSVEFLCALLTSREH